MESSIKFVFNYIYMGGYMYMCADAYRGQKWALDPLDPKIQMVVIFRTGVLGIEFVSSGRTIAILF